uniref:Putative secreted protein n=1 Tax=Ixodes scapularis TaxID=6945 RepID=A0A4D5RE42_IXOSC
MASRVSNCRFVRPFFIVFLLFVPLYFGFGRTFYTCGIQMYGLLITKSFMPSVRRFYTCLTIRASLSLESRASEQF